MRWRYNNGKLQSWTDGRCPICQRFLTKKQHFCSKCRRIKNRKASMKYYWNNRDQILPSKRDHERKIYHEKFQSSRFNKKGG